MAMTSGTGRLAGLLYLIVVATGIFSLAYVPGQLVVADDPQATMTKIVASQQLFRQGIAAFLVMQVAFLLLPFALYPLLESAGRRAATLMVVLAVTSVPLGLSALVHRLDLLSLLADPVVSRMLDPGHVRAEVVLSLEAYRNGLHVTKLFWGLWLLPFGWLVFESRRLPRVLGVLLMLGCFGYVLQVFGDLLIPGYADSAIASYVPLPAAVGEIGTCLWLLIFGARRPLAKGPDEASAG
ncbi:MAG: DUF4386 domain-containing protein [Pseudoxanthomonas sp.]